MLAFEFLSFKTEHLNAHLQPLPLKLWIQIFFMKSGMGMKFSEINIVDY